MTQTMTAPHPDLLQEAQKVASLVTTARRLLGEDRMVDLSALEERVGALCRGIQAAPLEQARGLKASIAGILEDLDQLEEALTARDAGTGAGETGRRQTMAAYGRARDPS